MANCGRGGFQVRRAQIAAALRDSIHTWDLGEVSGGFKKVLRNRQLWVPYAWGSLLDSFPSVVQEFGIEFFWAHNWEPFDFSIWFSIMRDYHGHSRPL